ncbi:MAG: hypothetical protein KJ000_17930 [Pirellulaceae bacterium]|nr:hypothetical protein [Pirellulaceae bacterium]
MCPKERMVCVAAAILLAMTLFAAVMALYGRTQHVGGTFRNHDSIPHTREYFWFRDQIPEGATDIRYSLWPRHLFFSAIFHLAEDEFRTWTVNTDGCTEELSGTRSIMLNFGETMERHVVNEGVRVTHPNGSRESNASLSAEILYDSKSNTVYMWCCFK